MSVVIKTSPKVRVLTRNYVINAARNSTIYEFQRKDISVFTVVDNGSGLVQINCLENPLLSPHLLVANDPIYLNSGSYSSTGTVTTITENAGLWEIVTDIAFTTATNAGYMNILTKKNYEVQLKLFYANSQLNLTETYELTYTMKSNVDSIGVAEIDLYEGLKSIMTKEIRCDYAGVSQKDTSDNGFFLISYRECWKNYEGTWLPADYLYIYINAAFQQFENGSYNNLMMDYDISFTTAAKFLTDFEEPVHFLGYPFNIDTYVNLFGINFFNYSLTRVCELLDINQTQFDSVEENLSEANVLHLQHLFLPSGIDCDSKYLRVYLNCEARDCEINCYVEPDYIDCDYVACD